MNISTTSTTKKRKPQKQEITQFKLKLTQSQYTKMYKLYMQKQYPLVETLIKKIVQMAYCRQYYLKYPLDALLRGVCKKMLINVYELVVFGYFLSQVEWRLDPYIFATLSQVFPNVIHVNQPTDGQKLKQISIFLYFSSYSIKQFLTQDMTIYRQQMTKIIPQFQHIQNSWTSTQHTVGQVLSPRILNKFYQQTMNIKNFPDYNFCVDKILQISPCYDITAKNDKSKQLLNFGFMQMANTNNLNTMTINNNNSNINRHNIGNEYTLNSNSHYGNNNNNSMMLMGSNGIGDLYFHMSMNNDNNDNQIKMDGIDMNDFKQFDGDI